MPCKTDIAAARTIGIDTGKNTLHMVGLNQEAQSATRLCGAGQLAITLRATPSFEAFGRFLETANPFVGVRPQRP
jgi:hypothetical protein